ncbi:dihydroorotase [Buchnera aphidicola (Aphis helianthi)]|uniref:Dihydroorotase n=1 Tax=Buchnera aphidicola (Aphis helianthi) TaxID=2315802 RepID=A0A4D6XK46_9GAMM|nr:dihydroorotase [Buchnera aphidicola]QCI17152.1 dihydroorotase [Buchnera aphidicola (Aphis helianthi)]
MSSLKKIKIIKPDDWHLHLRDKKILKKILRYTQTFYRRAIIMPNLNKPITNCKKAIAYKRRIINASQLNTKFEPLMICYLTKETSLQELKYGFFKKIFIGAKLYPDQSTTNSKTGINKISEIFHILELMQKINMPLLIHGEDNNFDIDIYDREAKFIENTLVLLRKTFPELKIILEHITTKEAVYYIEENNSPYLAGTITPHHLMLNRNNMFIGGIQPNLYCLPILKRNIHQNALRQAISNGSTRFFLGSDSAPHLYENKINLIGCAGIFNAPSSLLCYVTVFEEMKALKYFESFCSKNGPNFYNIPINKESITLIKKPYKILEKVSVGKEFIIPFLSGEILNWSIL